MVDELAPDRADLARRVQQLVRDAGQRPIAGEQMRRRIVLLAIATWRIHWLQTPGDRRRSSVIGNSRCGASTGGT